MNGVPAAARPALARNRRRENASLLAELKSLRASFAMSVPPKKIPDHGARYTCGRISPKVPPLQGILESSNWPIDENATRG
jgi:hypothetical protein